MISLRLPNPLEKKLNQHAKIEHISKSQIVINALEYYFHDEKKTLTPYELGSKYFGKYEIGRSDLSQKYKIILKEKLLDKIDH